MQLSFITLSILFFAWIILFPRDALALIVELKRHLRLQIIQRAGQESSQELARQLHEWATREGIEGELVDDVLEAYRSETIYRLGTKQANAQLGEPTPFERYH